MPNQPIHGVSNVDTSQPGKASKPDNSQGGAAFKALLEGLEIQSKGLAQTSESLTDSAGLVDAVGQSQRALEQARQLTDQLLEAYRANQQRHPA